MAVESLFDDSEMYPDEVEQVDDDLQMDQFMIYLTTEDMDEMKKEARAIMPDHFGPDYKRIGNLSLLIRKLISDAYNSSTSTHS